MNEPSAQRHSDTPGPTPPANRVLPWIWRALLGVCLLVLCIVPDPRPLGAPEWAVSAVRSVAGIGEATARLIATLVLRAGGLALLGVLLMLSIGSQRIGPRSLVAIGLAPVLAVATLWINLGFFPITIQIQIASVSAALGALAGLALRKNWIAAVGFVVIVGGLFAWGTSTGIGDDLDAATRAVGLHILSVADQVPDGDEGFARLLEIAFTFVDEHSERDDPILPNQAAILALGVILGEEQLADVARRHLDRTRLPEIEAIRARITIHGRKDWPRHFWVSAALTILSDADRSIAVGLTKELMDATPGGTGFSFPDLTADAAGNRFALAATRDKASAVSARERILAGVRIADFFPEVGDLPEGLTREAFQKDYGGLGGDGTRRVVDEIRRRLAACPALR